MGTNATGGRAESGYYPAVIETARIVNVNVADWSVDAVSEYSNRRFMDIQVMSPYFHFANGEGIYAMPEVGAACWVAQESSGRWAQTFVLGYQSLVDERVDPATGVASANFNSNRQNLNPGDIMLRGRDENFVVLRRGGVVQVGATPMTQRLYIPIQNILRDVCERYDLQSLAGDMAWQVDRTDQSDAGEVNTRFRLRSKTNAGEPEHAVILTTGSHKDDENLRLSLIVNESGESDVPQGVVQLRIDKEGTVTWTCEKDFTLSVAGAVSITAEVGDLSLRSSQGAGALTSRGDMLVQSYAGQVAAKGKTALVEGSTSAKVKAPSIDLEGKVSVGGAAAKEPIVLGTQLKNLLQQFAQALIQANDPAKVPPPTGNPSMVPAATSLLQGLSQITSKNNKTS